MDSIYNTDLKVKLYTITNYAVADKEFINNGYIDFDIESVITELCNHDKCYNFRIHKDNQYIFFGDIDHYNDSIESIRDLLKVFLQENYNLSFDDSDFKYTVNDQKSGSFHYSIPKWNASIKKLKEIHNNFIKSNKNAVVNQVNNKLQNCIDTTIYSEHWFRCPNQTKGSEVNTGKHIIEYGDMIDFIIEYIPSNSVNINDCELIIKDLVPIHHVKSSNTNIIVPKDNSGSGQIVNYKDDSTMLSTTMTKTEIYKNIFDECYKQDRFDKYEYWITVGMAIKNTFKDEDKAIDLFNYYSSKGSNYEGFEKTKFKYMTFAKKTDAGHTIATIYYYAIEDNKPKFIEIMNKNTLELGQTDICKYLKAIAGHRFLYKKLGDGNYKLYCYNGKYWQNDDIVMRQSINDELYPFLQKVLVEVYWNNREFHQIKSKLDKLKTISFKKDIIETYKEYGVNNDIKFDNKWSLFGFNNMVYDMEEQAFREYRYDDYVSMTTGYDWREPTCSELSTIERLIAMIMPVQEERELYLQILSTAIDGRCLEKFIIFNGGGGNGKGMINDLLILALGNYALSGSNAILFESSKTGSNPEKANIHKKRLVIFREPAEKHRFENSVVKELTGGGTFSARSHHEKETEKELNATIIVECNKKPLFSEDPTNAETRRIIDLYFRSTFTDDVNRIDPKNNIYMADSRYKTKDFQETHKFALLKILMREHAKYLKNNSCLNIPKSVANRTQAYLELSSLILQWFKDNYEVSTDPMNVCKLKDVFDDFVCSSYYSNLSKLEKRKYNKSFFVDYFETNAFLKKFCSKIQNAYSIQGWQKIPNNNNIT